MFMKNVTNKGIFYKWFCGIKLKCKTTVVFCDVTAMLNGMNEAPRGQIRDVPELW